MKWRFFGSAYASRSTLTGLLLLSTTVFVATPVVQGQSNTLSPIRIAFNNGRFDEVVRVAPQAILRTRKTGTLAGASEIGVFQANALMRLERYDEAGTLLEEALSDAERSKQPRIAAISLTKATLSRPGVIFRRR